MHPGASLAPSMASNRAHWGPSLVRVLACLLACAPQPTLTLPRPDAAAPAMMGAKIAQCGGLTVLPPDPSIFLAWSSAVPNPT